MHANLPRVTTPQAIIDARVQDNNIRAPRVRGSDGRGFCQVLPARILEGHATGTDQSLHHEALIHSGPYTETTARTPQQRMIGLGPDHTPITMSLLHIFRQ